MRTAICFVHVYSGRAYVPQNLGYAELEQFGQQPLEVHTCVRLWPMFWNVSVSFD